MPGTFIIKPIRAELREDKGLIHKMDPYCRVKIGKHTAKGSPCKEGGQYPHWDDAIVVQRDKESYCDIVLKDNNRLNPNRKVGECRIDLKPVEKLGNMTSWFSLFNKNKVEGKILLDIIHTPVDFHSQDIKLKEEKPKGEFYKELK